MQAYRSDLYGPERQAEYQFIKGLNLKDSVLQKGDCNQHENRWETHYNSTVKDVLRRDENLRKEDDFDSEKKSAAHQNSHVFGQDMPNQYDLTSRDYGRQIRRVSPLKVKIDRDIHIVDFSPRYYNTNNLGLSSMYHYSYNNNNGKLPFDHVTRRETQARTKDVRLTHFNLGSCKEKLSTETTHSYKPDSSTQEPSENFTAPNNQKSNIFKSGDWNSSSRSLIKKSVTTDDFGNAEKLHENRGYTKSFGKSVKKSLEDMPDYVKTHIGKNGSNSGGARTSLYKKDFLKDNDEFIKHRHIADAPPSSMVLPRDGSPVKSSTNKSDFLSFSKEVKIADRSTDLENNRIRNAENHLKPYISSRRQGLNSLTTITRNSYLKPMEDALTTKHQTAPLSKYRYLDTDAGLLKPRHSPMISEAKSKHTGKSMQNDLQSSVADAERQLLEDKTTHFALGTDQLRYKTEHTTQFNQPLGLDAKFPAAGIRNTDSAKHKRSQLRNVREDHLDNMSTSKDETVTTVMQEDFKPIGIRRFTDSQQRLIANLEKHPPRIAASHLFHLDDSKGPLVSRTKTDFINPAGNLTS